MDEEFMFKELSDIKIKNTRLKLFTGFQFVENPEYITKYSEMSMIMPEKLWLSTQHCYREFRMSQQFVEQTVV